MPYTLRELVTMAQARCKLAWAQTSLIAALVVNAHRDPDSEPARPEDFNPLADQIDEAEVSRRQIAYTTSDLSFLKPSCSR
jgi:hypothetical protein